MTIFKSLCDFKRNLKFLIKLLKKMETQKTTNSAVGSTSHELVKWPKVILFGDSLTQKSFDPHSGLWGVLLADKLQRTSDVVNRGFSGYNSRYCRIILPQIFSTSDVSDIVAFVIFLGANDSCEKNVIKNCQHVSLKDYEDNLEAMIDYLQGIGIAKEKIILISPPPYDHEKWTNFCKKIGKDLPPGDRQTSDYAAACIGVAKKKMIDYVDLFEAMIKEKNWSEYLFDGLHFNTKGGELLYNLLWPLIEKKVGDKLIFPDWKVFDEIYKL